MLSYYFDSWLEEQMAPLGSCKFLSWIRIWGDLLIKYTVEL